MPFSEHVTSGTKPKADFVKHARFKGFGMFLRFTLGEIQRVVGNPCTRPIGCYITQASHHKSQSLVTGQSQFNLRKAKYGQWLFHWFSFKHPEFQREVQRFQANVNLTSLPRF